MKNNPIIKVEVNFTCFRHGIVTIVRQRDTEKYLLKTLTQYQRAVRLLNAFVERNMK